MALDSNTRGLIGYDVEAGSLRKRNSIRSHVMLDYTEEDVGNIVSLEHVNLQVPDQAIATLFTLLAWV